MISIPLFQTRVGALEVVPFAEWRDLGEACSLLIDVDLNDDSFHHHRNQRAQY